MPVSYSQPSPGWNASGSPATRATNSSADIGGVSGPGKTSRSIIAACSGVLSSTAPHPAVQVRRWRTVMGRCASVVRSSGASGATSTRGLAASGNQRATGSSRVSAPSCRG